jgi:hypothetical protein
MANTVVWVDIPVLDLDRAIGFYAAVLGKELHKVEYPGFAIGVLPGESGDALGCLFIADEVQPSSQGPLVYLNCEGRLEEAVGVVDSAGGKVLQDKHQIGQHGFRAIILDSEGNRIALHSH